VNSINYIKIDEIIKKVDRLSNEDNIYGLKKNFEDIINKAQALKFLEIASNNQISLSLEKNGEKANIVVKVNDKDKTYLPRVGWTNNRGNQNEAFWLSNINGIENGLYFQYNKCYSKEVLQKLRKMEGFESLEGYNLEKYPSVEEHFEKFFEANKNNYDFVVIDLRNNSGGSVFPTMYMLIEFSTKSQLMGANYYVLTDRTTFSSGVLSTYMFDKFLNATVIGEPPSGKPNHPTEAKKTQLPNSKITVRYPTKKGSLIEMKGNVYDMDYLIEPTFEEYFGKKDIMFYKVLEIEGIL
jgi:C-terminal processing protease CtpA/Prc